MTRSASAAGALVAKGSVDAEGLVEEQGGLKEDVARAAASPAGWSAWAPCVLGACGGGGGRSSQWSEMAEIRPSR